MNTEIILFLISSITLTLMPGPDILFVISQSISKNRLTGVLISLGLCSGLLVHTVPLITACYKHTAAAYITCWAAGQDKLHNTTTDDCSAQL